MNVHSSISIEQQLREAHKARQARFAAAARRLQQTHEKPVSRAVKVVSAHPRRENPRDFVKAMCAEYGITYAQLIEENRQREMVAIRKTIIRATHEKFPTCSLPQLGKLFNRTHTTIMWSIGKLAGKQDLAKANAERDRRALDLYRDGVSMVDIAYRLGISETTVKAIKQRNKWENRSRVQVIDYAKITGEAYELYMGGCSMAMIAEKLCVSTATMTKIKRSNGWPERSIGGICLTDDQLKAASDMWPRHTAKEIAAAMGISVDTMLGIAMRHRELFPSKGKNWRGKKANG